MTSSPLSQHDLPRDAEGGDFGYGHRRHVPFWLIFLLLFFVFRAPFFWWWGYGWHAPNGGYVPGLFAVIPLVALGVLAFFALRFALPALDDAVRPRFRGRGAQAERDDERTQRLELDLLAARRQIKELEEKVAWQSKFLAAQTATPGAASGTGGAAAPEAPAGS